MSKFPYPHHVDEERKVVSIYFASGFPSTMAAAYLVKEHYPGYTAEIVSAPRLEKLQNQ
jgi:hypothetical protein|tara:strand:- start:31 stop:207 length:177 start_codon:yes stop_codon:yes gene_type:complete